MPKIHVFCNPLNKWIFAEYEQNSTAEELLNQILQQENINNFQTDKWICRKFIEDSSYNLKSQIQNEPTILMFDTNEKFEGTKEEEINDSTLQKDKQILKFESARVKELQVGKIQQLLPQNFQDDILQLNDQDGIFTQYDNRLYYKNCMHHPTSDLQFVCFNHKQLRKMCIKCAFDETLEPKPVILPFLQFAKLYNQKVQLYYQQRETQINEIVLKLQNQMKAIIQEIQNLFQSMINVVFQFYKHNKLVQIREQLNKRFLFECSNEFLNYMIKIINNNELEEIILIDKLNYAFISREQSKLTSITNLWFRKVKQISIQILPQFPHNNSKNVKQPKIVDDKIGQILERLMQIKTVKLEIQVLQQCRLKTIYLKIAQCATLENLALSILVNQKLDRKNFEIDLSINDISYNNKYSRQKTLRELEIDHTVNIFAGIIGKYE